MTPRRTALVLPVLLPALAVAVAQAAPSQAPQAAARTPQLTATQAVVHPGETLTLEGRGFPPDVHLALLAGAPGAEAQRIGGAQTGSRGRFLATIRIRAHSRPGALVTSACVDACRVKASARFRIVAP